MLSGAPPLGDFPARPIRDLNVRLGRINWWRCCRCSSRPGLCGQTTAEFRAAPRQDFGAIPTRSQGMFVKPSIEKAAFIVGLVVAGIVTSQTLGCMEPLPPPPAPLTAIHEAIADLSVRIFVRLRVCSIPCRPEKLAFALRILAS